MHATGNLGVNFMHCVPALHNTESEVGRQRLETRGLFFDQADDRLHTIKAAMVATIGT